MYISKCLIIINDINLNASDNPITTGRPESLEDSVTMSTRS
jgi:hypothetical protein